MNFKRLRQLRNLFFCPK